MSRARFLNRTWHSNDFPEKGKQKNSLYSLGLPAFLTIPASVDRLFDHQTIKANKWEAFLVQFLYLKVNESQMGP